MKIQLLTDNEIEISLFGKCLDNFSPLKLEDEPAADVDLIILNINASRRERSKRLGASFLQKIRRDYFIPAPVIAYSFESFETLVADFPILETKGISFLPLPFSSEDLLAQINKSPSRLTKSELVEIVRRCGNLKEEWRRISHQIGGYLSDYLPRKKQIENLFDEWTKSINRFASEESRKYSEEVRNLLDLPAEAVDMDKLKSAVQTLDQSLRDNPDSPIDFSEIFPKCPPKGFSKIMIADDEPLDSLIFDLQNEYNYKVVGQAKGVNEAKRQVREKQPTVILSDFYFKSSEHDKTTDKKFGIEFMKFARNFNLGSVNAPENPMVAVISKTSLDPLEIPSGVLDCSGTRNATNPEFIHAAIWMEALRKGITEGEIEGKPWKLEYYCRQRLEPYAADLPKLTRQWESFNETVGETLLMIQSIRKSGSAGETLIIRQIINALEPHKNVKDFSFEQVSEVFSEVGKAHQAAKTPPESDVKNLIRNILHGKIEQFAAVTNHIDFTRKAFAGISTDLISLPEFREIGIRLKKTLDDFNEKEPLIPFLRSLKNDTDFALDKLSDGLSPKPNPRPAPAVTKKINIIVVEDNKVWTEIVLSAIKKTESRLGKNFEISASHFANAEDALKAVPQINKTPLKTAADEIKTIAIVDICLPADNQQPPAIPDMKHGIELLKKLSDYKVSVPTIVFSTKSSLEDIRDIGKFGIADENFISKEDFEAEPSIVRSLIALVEKKQKYFIRRAERDKKGTVYYAFSINGICIPFSNELNATFQALFELREEGDRANKTQFTAKEIYTRKLQNNGKREVKFSKQEKHSIQSQINEIRELIYNTFRKNSRYIDVRDLIKTFINETEEYGYELNAELPSLEDEEDFEEDYEIFKNRKYNVLVIEKNDDHRHQIVNALKSISNTVKVIDSLDRDFTQTVSDFRPDVVCVDLPQVECWKKIKSVLPNERLGVIVTTANSEPNKKTLIATALKSGILNRNIVSTNKEAWINSFLTELNNEKRRVFLGEVVDCLENLDNEPIVEVLAGSDLPNGVLKLRINGEFFTMNKSNISKIIGHLLQNSKTLIPLETIKQEAVGSSEPVTKDDQTGWTKKIRNKIQKEWLKTDDRSLAMKILNSSEKGMKLNVQTIYPPADG
jgi:CheY-like chemotaxis protein